MAPLAMSMATSSTGFQTMRLRTASRPQSCRRVLVVPRAQDSDREYYQGIPVPKKEERASDSYTVVEDPVRKSAPDGGPPVAEREDGWDRVLESKKLNPDVEVLPFAKVGLADAMRFKGAAPEVINSRLAMLGFVICASTEAATGLNVFQQIQARPLIISTVAVLFTVASLVPIVRGVQRRGNAVFTPDAEIINGRLAMLGFASLIVTELIKKTPIF